MEQFIAKTVVVLVAVAGVWLLVTILVTIWANFHHPDWVGRLNLWFIRRRIFDGVVGHSIVAVAALLVTAWVFQEVAIEYRTQEICTDELRDDILSVLRAPGTAPVLLHIRDGGRKTEEVKSELLEFKSMYHKGTGWCAKIRYNRKLGFQFKIFVFTGDDPHERLEGIKIKWIEGLATQPAPAHPEQKVPSDGRCRTAGGIGENAWVTEDVIPPKGPWRVWFLLKDYLCIKDEKFAVVVDHDVWNNFFQPSAAAEDELLR